MAYSVTITNTNGLKYRFFSGEVPNLTFDINTKVFKQSLPDDDGDNAIVINLGREKGVQWSFKLFNTTGEDAAVGTHTSTVETITQKLNYLITNFITAGVQDLYTVEIQTHNGNFPNQQGIIERFSLNPINQNPDSLTGNFSIGVGGGVQGGS